MSLHALLVDEEYKEIFSPAAPSLDIFQPMASTTAADDGAAVEMPTPTDPERLSHLATAFRYLFQAQIAHWTGDGVGGPVIATAGLQVLLNEFNEPHLGLIGLITAGEPFFEPDGQLRPQVLRAFAESPLPFLDIPADEYAGDLPGLCEYYRKVYGTWLAYARGENDAQADLLSASWFLAGLDHFFRSFKYPAALSAFLAQPTTDEAATLQGLWQRLLPWQELFASSATRSYQPTFGVASQLVGGANCDLYFDRTLLTVTFADEAGMGAEAHQLTGYYVLAAMGGQPWPVDRLILYQAQAGRLLAVDTAELRRNYDLKAFAYRLLGAAEKRYKQLWAAQGTNPEAPSQKNIERHLTGNGLIADS